MCVLGRFFVCGGGGDGYLVFLFLGRSRSSSNRVDDDVDDGRL